MALNTLGHAEPNAPNYGFWSQVVCVAAAADLTEAYDPCGTVEGALLSLRCVVGVDESQGVIDMYMKASQRHGATAEQCDCAVTRGRSDRHQALAAAATTLFTAEEIIADLHLSLAHSAGLRDAV